MHEIHRIVCQAKDKHEVFLLHIALHQFTSSYYVVKSSFCIFVQNNNISLVTLPWTTDFAGFLHSLTLQCSHCQKDAMVIVVGSLFLFQKGCAALACQFCQMSLTSFYVYIVYIYYCIFAIKCKQNGVCTIWYINCFWCIKGVCIVFTCCFGRKGTKVFVCFISFFCWMFSDFNYLWQWSSFVSVILIILICSMQTSVSCANFYCWFIRQLFGLQLA